MRETSVCGGARRPYVHQFDVKLCLLGFETAGEARRWIFPPYVNSPNVCICMYDCPRSHQKNKEKQKNNEKKSGILCLIFSFSWKSCSLLCTIIYDITSSKTAYPFFLICSILCVFFKRRRVSFPRVCVYFCCINSWLYLQARVLLQLQMFQRCLLTK